MAVTESTRTLKLIRDSRNWGDKIGAYLFQLITGDKPKILHMTDCSTGPHFLTVGSVLRMADSNSIIWGTGFLTPSDSIGGLNWGRQDSEVIHQPRQICAVRGPLTRKKLQDMGIDCPKVYGDPASLLAKFYRPRVPTQFRIGIIPHFKDRRSSVIQQLGRDERVIVIDPVFSRFAVTNYTKYLRFVDQILQCEYIASSSLHGLVMADAYGVPARWCSTSDAAWESEFKFFDYFASVGRPDVPPLRILDTTTADEILRSFQPYDLQGIVDDLLAVCPFN